MNTLLTGSLIRDGDNLRITYQLVDVQSEKILGQGVIDLKYDHLLAVQDKVTSQLISELQLSLSPSEAERLKPENPVKPLAHEYYLQGLDFHGQHKFPLAIKMLEKSTATDPNFAPAWAYLGASYAECERARQLAPLVKGNGSVLNSYLYLEQYGKFLKSLPVDDSSFILFYRGFGEVYEKQFDQAAKDFDRAYELEPILYTGIGKALSDSIHGRKGEGFRLLSELENKIRQRGVGDPEATYKIAQTYAVLGDRTSALRALRSSIESGFFSYPYIAKDPLLSDLHSDREFAQILHIARERHETFRTLR